MKQFLWKQVARQGRFCVHFFCLVLFSFWAFQRKSSDRRRLVEQAEVEFDNGNYSAAIADANQAIEEEKRNGSETL